MAELSDITNETIRYEIEEYLEIPQEILVARSPGGSFGGPDTVSGAKN